MFLANYGDGLSDVPLPAMLETFRQSNAIASLLLVQPTASFDIVHAGSGGMVREICPLTRTDIWINGGFFVMRNEIFRLHSARRRIGAGAFQRLIEKQALLAYKYTGFWQCMDTFKDKQRLEELNQGAAPWKVWNHIANGQCGPHGSGFGRRMIHLNLDAREAEALQILCLGSHSDDIEIGCGGTILGWPSSIRTATFTGSCSAPWV